MCFACFLLKLTGDDHIVESARKDLYEWYRQMRYSPAVDHWPPYQPKRYYTPAIRIHYRGSHGKSEIITTAGGFRSRDENQCNNEYMESVNDLFAPFEGMTPVPYIILIEGAPGVGKTMMSKDIALQWTDHKILKNKKILLLLFMHNPQVMKQITSTWSLVKYFCLDDEVTRKLTDWLIRTNGRYLTILLDGYNECFVTENKDYFIIDSIIGRKVLTECGLVITSRRAALSHLCDIANRRAEVLGFTEEARLNFIQSAVQGNYGKILQLEKYLKCNEILNKLCYNPLNMSILLCLVEGGISTLPTTQTNFYGKFIIMTIVYYLKKNNGIIIANISRLSEFPHPYDQVVKELSQFAFLALQKTKWLL